MGDTTQPADGRTAPGSGAGSVVGPGDSGDPSPQGRTPEARRAADDGAASAVDLDPEAASAVGLDPDRALAVDLDPDDAPLDLDDAPLDPAAGVALIEEQRAKVLEATDVDGRILFGAWGAAWVLGFGALWATALDEPLLPWAHTTSQWVFFALLVAAMIVTAVHIGGRSTGVRGASAMQGAMYGWAWSLGFAGIGALGFALDRLDASAAVTGTVMTTGSTIVVGALYMAGGAVWKDRNQFALGAWIGVVTVVATVVGYPHLLGVMALAGGGGMLVMAAVDAVRRR